MRGWDDTIAAIATSLGEAGIGVIRISGPRAVAVGERVFRATRGKPLGERRSHMMVHGWVVDLDGKPVDEALAVVMRGPRSFTGEDVVELHCHGGQVAVRRVLEATLAAGVRLAEPGEFTKRAFLNGRIDLSQAEAVIDIIRAKTERAMDAAVSHLRGSLRGKVTEIRNKLLEMMAHLEADIDFPELELEIQTKEEVEEGCRWCLGEVNQLLAGARQGRLLREGMRVVLAGRPNVGKSSLLNRLVRDNRAIVTDVPGTTRDVIEEWVNIRGFPVVLADTAGIRETLDTVERLGVDRSRAALARADVILFIVDAGVGITPEDSALSRELPRDAFVIGVLNKSDLSPDADVEQLSVQLYGAPVVKVSALNGQGIDGLEELIAEAAGSADKEESLIANVRQEEALHKAREQLTAALETLGSGLGSDLVSIEIRSAWLALGEISGDTVGEDLLDQIFSRFCIGK